MVVITRLRGLIETWLEAWFSPLDYYETAIGIEPVPLQGVYQIWVSIRGTKLFWLSGHHSLASAEAALTHVVAWASQHEQMDPVAHAVEMTLLCNAGDFRARAPSERIQALIRQRIKQRDPSVLIVSVAPSLEDETAAETVPDERTMHLIRATNQVKVWLQLQALCRHPLPAQEGAPKTDIYGYQAEE